MQQREHKEEAREEHEMVEKTVSPLYDSPHCNKTITRTLIGLVIVLLWDKYVNVERIGVSRLGFGLGAVGIILMAGAWFSYLHLDGLKPIDTAKKKFGVKNKRKKQSKAWAAILQTTLMRKLCRMRSWMNLKRQHVRWQPF